MLLIPQLRKTMLRLFRELLNTFNSYFHSIRTSPLCFKLLILFSSGRKKGRKEETRNDLKQSKPVNTPQPNWILHNHKLQIVLYVSILEQINFLKLLKLFQRGRFLKLFNSLRLIALKKHFLSFLWQLHQFSWIPFLSAFFG